MVTRWGNDAPEFENISSEMLTTFLLTMHATPYYYFGDELAMNNIKFDIIEDYRDIESINNYKRIKNAGGDMENLLKIKKFLPAIIAEHLFNRMHRSMQVLQQAQLGLKLIRIIRR